MDFQRASMDIISLEPPGGGSGEPAPSLSRSECTEEGWVHALTPDGKAVVRVERSEACHHCAAKGTCSVGSGKQETLDIVVENPLGARPGQRVALAIPEASLIKATFVLYLLPALLLLAGAVAGSALAPGDRPADPWAFVGSMLGLGLGFGIAWLLGRRMGRSRHYRPYIRRVEGEGDPRWR